MSSTSPIISKKRKITSARPLEAEEEERTPLFDQPTCNLWSHVMRDFVLLDHVTQYSVITLKKAYTAPDVTFIFTNPSTIDIVLAGFGNIEGKVQRKEIALSTRDDYRDIRVEFRTCTVVDDYLEFFKIFIIECGAKLVHPEGKQFIIDILRTSHRPISMLHYYTSIYV